MMKENDMTFPVQDSKIQLITYDGGRLNNKGSIKIPIRFENKTTIATFYIVDTDGPAIIGLPSSRELKLITIHCSIEKEKIDLA